MALPVEANLALFNAQAQADRADAKDAATFAKEQGDKLDNAPFHTRVLYLRARFEQLLVYGASIYQEMLDTIRQCEQTTEKLDVGKRLMKSWLRARTNVIDIFKTFKELEYPLLPHWREAYIRQCQEAMYYLHDSQALLPSPPA